MDGGGDDGGDRRTEGGGLHAGDRWSPSADGECVGVDRGPLAGWEEEDDAGGEGLDGGEIGGRSRRTVWSVCG